MKRILICHEVLLQLRVGAKIMRSIKIINIARSHRGVNNGADRPIDGNGLLALGFLAGLVLKIRRIKECYLHNGSQERIKCDTSTYQKQKVHRFLGRRSVHLNLFDHGVQHHKRHVALPEAQVGRHTHRRLLSAQHGVHRHEGRGELAHGDVQLAQQQGAFDVLGLEVVTCVQPVDSLQLVSLYNEIAKNKKTTER